MHLSLSRTVLSNVCPRTDSIACALALKWCMRLLCLLGSIVIFLPPYSLAKEPLRGVVFPLMSAPISSDYGPRHHPIRGYSHHHRGIDLAAPLGTPIRAVASGLVVFADPYAGYGKLIVIEHAGGFTSHYGHCHALHVSPGQVVTAGDIIGEVGNTGLSTGPHLHLEIRHQGEPRDPSRYVPGLAAKARG